MTKREITIEKGVPLPTRAASRAPQYPFQFMDVNESFFLPGANHNTVHSAINRFRNSDKGKGKEFALRSVSEVVKGEEEKGEQEGVRVWRTT